ncbi:phage portal protein [Microbacterium esteraromaticum]|uniref:Phage portal protein n=1 Tax=Microbacterium esteraromaticum TaxID=57043 RepID=A0A7D7WC12_9MICO|nr:phage portal protein [Microbacterium esteraromaticum]QMU97835.1 phage portal protein [Microbacterium esteraromaticum]
MADVNLRIPGLDDDETVTLNLLAKQLQEKQAHNKRRSDLYDGKQALRQVGTVIPPQYYRLGLALGWAAKGVDGLARRCNLERMVWPDGDLDSLGYQELEDSNFLLSELAQGRTDSLIHGLSYLITTKGEGDEPAALVHAKDALNATGEWNNRKRRLDNLLSVTSRERDRITGFVLYLDGETINADIVDGKWQVDRQEHPWHVPVDPLVYKPRTSKRMGRSRITRAAISHQFAALRALVRLEGHMDIYTIPQLILLGASDRIFKNADGSYKASWQIALGRALGIPDAVDDEGTPIEGGRADVKHIPAQSPEPHLADLNALAKLTAREYDLPDSAFALTDMANPTSADSYNASREDLIAEAEGATDDWSVPIRRAVTRALAIQNGVTEIPDDWASITTEWRSPVYLSRAAQADAGAKEIASLPEWVKETTVAMRRLGWSQQDIDLALQERRQSVGRQSAAALIAARLGEAADGDPVGVEGAADASR